MARKTSKLSIEYVDIDSLKPNEYNPKKMSAKAAKDLERSIVEFGIVDPLVVNGARGREGVIIGGHQRYIIYRKLGYRQVPVVYVNIPDIDKEKELCLRLTKNTGEWDIDLLANFDEDLLANVGFSDDEMNRVFSLVYEEELPEVKKEIREYKRVHVLLSFEPEKFLRVKPLLEKILEIDGIEYEQSAN